MVSQVEKNNLLQSFLSLSPQKMCPFYKLTELHYCYNTPRICAVCLYCSIVVFVHTVCLTLYLFILCIISHFESFDSSQQFVCFFLAPILNKWFSSLQLGLLAIVQRLAALIHFQPWPSLSSVSP